jgi:hypothetical protein
MGDETSLQEEILVKLKKIKPVSNSLVFATFFSIISFFIALLFFVLLFIGVEKVIEISPLEVSFIPLLLVLLVPIAVWIFVFVFCIVFCFAFNLCLKVFKGVGFVLQEEQIEKVIQKNEKLAENSEKSNLI